MLADLYFDIEVRVIPVNEDSGFKFDATKMEDYLDDKTSTSLELSQTDKNVNIFQLAYS
ncbi:hypothetical protein AWENTII_005241 [Aspergillus wentii]